MSTELKKITSELGINPKTIRYYEDIGLIPQVKRTAQGYRLYDQNVVDRIAFILRARALDFSLNEIAEILAYHQHGEMPCTYVTTLVSQQISAIDAKIAALQMLRQDLEAIDAQAQTSGNNLVADDDCICHLIEDQTFTKLSTIQIAS